MADLQLLKGTSQSLQTEIVATHFPKTERLHHIPVLDGVRTIAILAVMVFHFFQNGPALSSPSLKALGKVAILGQTGVDLFFVLSGFLITGILLNLRGRHRALSHFYLRRATRIFPLYYTYLTGAFLLLPLLHAAPQIAWADQWWFWAYAQNVQDTFIPNFKFFGPGHFWSLAVEEHFYLVWPFLMLWLPERQLKAASFGTIGLALLTRVLLVRLGYPVFYFTLCRMDAIAVGALLAILMRDEEAFAKLGQWLRRWGIYVGLVLLPLYAMFTGAANPAVQVFKFTLLALICAAFLVLALTARKQSHIARFLGCRPIGIIAKGSYALYVFHPAIFEVCRPLYNQLPFALSLMAAFGITGVAAFLSWHLLEMPFLQLRTRSGL